MIVLRNNNFEVYSFCSFECSLTQYIKYSFKEHDRDNQIRQGARIFLTFDIKTKL